MPTPTPTPLPTATTPTVANAWHCEYDTPSAPTSFDCAVTGWSVVNIDDLHRGTEYSVAGIALIVLLLGVIAMLGVAKR
jgi:hypothetical protein